MAKEATTYRPRGILRFDKFALAIDGAMVRTKFKRDTISFFRFPWETVASDLGY